MKLHMQKRVAANIRCLRLTFDYSQNTVSDAVGIARCTYAQLESAARIPSADTLFALSRFYGVSMDFILHFETDRLKKEIREADCSRKKLPDLMKIYFCLSEENKELLLKRAAQLFREDSR